ncbi:MAG: 4Fe-4S binding protein [Chloroflexota bacterium]|nr:4Fe-4S binding protein [Chloroflexota bacterium]
MTQLADVGEAQIAPSSADGQRLNLLSQPLVKRVLTHRLFQFAVILPNLFVFTVIILSGLFGTPVGNANFSIIFVWIVWWAILIMLLIPVGARVWCTMCPIPAVGEWVQRRAVVDRSPRRPLTLGKDWPKPLRNIWVQNFSFVAVAAFSAIILTRPFVTGALLLGFMVAALALFLVYRRRAFCRYVCPVSGFIGLYSTVAPLEIRVIDPDVCLRHCGIKGKECVKGSAEGYGCPWMEYPGTLDRNSYCGMCTECLKTCPQDNLALSLRPFGADLLVPTRRLDEAFKGFIMLGAAVLYSVVMLGRWGWIKDWANLGSGSILDFAGYVALLVGGVLVVMPGLFYAITWAARLLSRANNVPVRQLFVSFAYTTVPLGLAAWIAFSLSFLFINVSYAIPVLSDPLGWGWNLFGTADYEWTPYFPQLLPYLQVPVLAVGLVLSVLLGQRIAMENFGNAEQARRSVLPVAVFSTAITLVLLWLYMG